LKQFRSIYEVQKNDMKNILFISDGNR